MRDNLGWMKDEKFVTGTVKEMIEFVEYYGVAVAPDELEKLDKNMQMVIITPDGLKLSITSI